ncbi:RND family efflux transporter, MFP subunit [Desulfocapsa sulfexigens DSM 10523]|uniref:RND family efflux transporter, MFP subunit n=2 Tax=Desulfocapsa TaxID=53318 RepID=M1P6R3_DESSD|nr:RND family efflux transporter, MFP subunit [Desulfocapsa sulfexigens DSM 10523]
MIMSEQKNSMRTTVIIRVVACLIILLIGLGGFRFLKSRKKAPSHAVQVERPLKVAAVAAMFADVPVSIEAHGELRSIRMVEIAAEVAGSVVEVHPRLQTGEVIAKGELLFAIDDRDYRNDYESNRARLAILKRDKELTAKELERARILFEKNKVGTRAGVEKAEQAANNSADKLAQVQQAMIRAEINLERCMVYAPFTCRITSKNIEKGQYVAPGKIVLGLADDSVLELEVPLDSRDAFAWLQFSENKVAQSASAGSDAWFSAVKPVECEVVWTEDAGNRAVATMNRVSFFDQKTRTVKVVLRLDSKQFAEKNIPMPLVSGMFCRVVIPGGTMKKVVGLPRWAVSFENTVYVVRDGRLETVPVKVARVQDNKAYVNDGLDQGDMVVTTRLVNPLERSLVDVIQTATPSPEGEK